MTNRLVFHYSPLRGVKQVKNVKIFHEKKENH